MHLTGWEIWLALALVLAGAELTHGALVLLALAIACVPAAVASALGGGVPAQLVAFTAALLAELPVVAKLLQKRRIRRVATNAEAIVGKRVKVLQPVTEHADGVVLLTGEHWKARTIAGEIKPGADAQVVQRDGLCLIVVPLDRSLP